MQIQQLHCKEAVLTNKCVQGSVLFALLLDKSDCILYFSWQKFFTNSYIPQYKT